MTDALSVVEHWLAALNEGDSATLASLSSADCEVVGGRRSCFGRPLVEQWARRSRMTAVPVGWYGDGGPTVVLHCDATWHDADGSAVDTRRVAMTFEVDRRKVACLARYPDLDRALRASRLSRADELARAVA